MEGGPDSLCAAVTRLAEPPDVQLSCILNGAPIVTPPRLPIQTRFGWALDGDRWAFGWGWMGPQSPSKRVLDGIAMGIWMGVSSRRRSPQFRP